MGGLIKSTEKGLNWKGAGSFIQSIVSKLLVLSYEHIRTVATSTVVWSCAISVHWNFSITLVHKRSNV